MPVLQKANLGVAPSGAGGDDQRTANMRFNANVDAIAARVPLEYSYLADTATLLPSHAGSRFGLAMPGPGKVVTLPLASSVPVNGCIHLYNVGPPVRVGLQGSDGTQITYLNTGDWAKYIGDGTAWWHVAERGRLMWDETVGGHLTVGNGLNVSGDVSATGRVRTAGLTVDGGAIVGGGVSTSGPFTMTQGLSTGQTRVYNNPGEYNVVLQAGAPGKEMWAVFDPNGYLILPQRPRWLNGLIPWDNGNFNPASYAALASDQTFKGTNIFEKSILSSFAPADYGSILVATRAVGYAFNDWGKSSAVVRVECDNNQAAYQIVHAQKTGQRDLFAMTVYAGGSANSNPMTSFTFTGTVNAHQFYDGGNAVFVGSLSQGSDYRIKTLVENIDTAAAYDGVRRLRFVDYLKTTNVGEDAERRIAGVIAHEAQEVFSNVVSGEKDALEDDGRLKLQTVDYNGLGVYVGAAVQHMANLIESLTSDVVKLRAEVAMLRGGR